MTDLKQLLINLASSIVDKPEEITVDEEVIGNSVVYTLHVADSDMGKIIGKHGKNARCIRTIMKTAAAKDGMKASVDIAE